MELEPGLPTLRSPSDEMLHQRPTAKLLRDGHPVLSRAVPLLGDGRWEGTLLAPQSPVQPVIFFLHLSGAASEQSETIQPGDELLHLAGTAMQGLTRFEAWNIIKTLPDGPVPIVIRRKSHQAKGTAGAGDP